MNFLAKKREFFRGFSKSLKISRLGLFLKKMAFRGFQKSTPFENLALTFENLACLQKREK